MWLIYCSGAIAWVTTALVAKDGPGNSIDFFRNTVERLLKRLFGPNTVSPFGCFHCASFWVGIVIIIAFYADPIVSRPIIQFLGILGVGQALRGLSGEYK